MSFLKIRICSLEILPLLKDFEMANNSPAKCCVPQNIAHVFLHVLYVHCSHNIRTLVFLELV